MSKFGNKRTADKASAQGTRPTGNKGAYGLVRDTWQPETPRRALPRSISAKLRAAVAGMWGKAIITGGNSTNDFGAPGQIAVTDVGAVSEFVVSGILYATMLRIAPGVPTENSRLYGLQSIHGYLDPSGPELGQALVAADTMYTNPSGGTSDYYFGWHALNTGADTSTFVGVAWHGVSSGNWTARVSDGAGASNDLYSYDSGIAASGTTVVRLGIVLDGNTHSVGFYVNNALVGSYAPSAVPDQMGAAGPYFGHRMVTATGATGALGFNGGGRQRLLSIVEV